MQQNTDAPNRPTVGKLNIVMVGVTDLDRSVAFYHETLGIPLQGRHGEGNRGLAFLDAGGVTLGLSTELGRSSTPMAGAVELVLSVKHVGNARRSLIERRVTFLGEPKQVTPTEFAAYFRDPDGHLLSLFGPGE